MLARIMQLLLTLAPVLSPTPAPATPGSIAGFEPGMTTLHVEPSGTLDLSAAQELVLTGENRTDQPIVLVIRIDDTASVNYATRSEIEQTVLPGPFRVRSSVRQWKSPSGRMMDPGSVRRIIVSSGYGGAPVFIAALQAEAGLHLPHGSLGLQFGPKAGPVFPGFEPVTPEDPRLHGKPVPVLRPGGNPLIGTGIKGVERFEQPWPDGPATVSLWIDDPGEWELLPHPLNRRIRLNGETVLEYHDTPAEWVNRVYLAGRETEAISDPWAAFGRRRGGLLTADVMISGGKLTLEMAGDSMDALYISGLLIEPKGDRVVLRTVEAERRTRFLEAWPVVGPRPAAPVGTLAMEALAEGAPVRADWRPGDAGNSASLAIAPGTSAFVDLMVASPDDDAAPAITLVPPSQDGRRLPSELRWGQWRFSPAGGSPGSLQLTAEHLRGDGVATLRRDVPRRLNVLVRVPEDATPGHYVGALRVESHGAVAERPIAIDVLPVVLPPADRPIGLYHEAPAWDLWFDDLAKQRARGLGCDMALMRSLGLTGMAPPLSTPASADVGATEADLMQARNAGFTLPLLAYAPVKRIIAAGGFAELTPVMATLKARLAAQGAGMPIWSIADEPGDPGSLPEDLRRIRAAIRAGDPTAQVAGQLNRPEDRALLQQFDVVLLDAGYGIDATDLQTMRSAGVLPWLYNMPDVELASGFFLWRSGAAGYLQWHGRATTADPFDPTDGREADVQFLPVQFDPCPAVPDVSDALLRMSRGIGDLRWMLWLEQRAKGDPKAAGLLREVAGAVPATWTQRQTMQVDLPALRQRIIAYAVSNPAAR